MTKTDPSASRDHPNSLPESEDEASGVCDASGIDGPPHPEHLRLLEAMLFASPEPLTLEHIRERMPDGAEIETLLERLEAHYRSRGIVLVEAGGRWFFRTADDLAEQMKTFQTVSRRLSRAAMETLAIIAYHQPVTRAEIEEIRGVGLNRGTLDTLLACGWIVPKGRRQTAGRPTTWGTSPSFLTDFGLESLKALPGLGELKAAGLLDKRPAMLITDLQSAADDSDTLGDNEDSMDEAGSLEAATLGEEGAGEGEAERDQKEDRETDDMDDEDGNRMTRGSPDPAS